MTMSLHPIARALRAAFAPLHQTLTSYMLRAGLMLALDDTGVPGDSLLAGDTPADPAAPADPLAAAPAGEAKPADGEAKPEDKPQVKAPEKYEFKAPEGYEIDAEVLTKFDPVLRELDLTQEQAQKLIDFAPEFIGKHIEQTAQKTAETVLTQLGFEDVRGWADAIKKDPDVGGDKLAESRAAAMTAVDRFGSPELKRLIGAAPLDPAAPAGQRRFAPLGNNPALFKFLARVGREISADGFVPGGKNATPTRPFYDNSPQLKA